jgi:hypothetical protein|tara:strand:- start:912 stop:1160 length:249 start_codon:yes stop_codon:yes gene_type:complete
MLVALHPTEQFFEPFMLFTLSMSNLTIFILYLNHLILLYARLEALGESPHHPVKWKNDIQFYRRTIYLENIINNNRETNDRL